MVAARGPSERGDYYGRGRTVDDRLKHYGEIENERAARSQ